MNKLSTVVLAGINSKIFGIDIGDRVERLLNPIVGQKFTGRSRVNGIDRSPDSIQVLIRIGFTPPTGPVGTHRPTL